MAFGAGLLVRWWGRWVAVAAVLLNVMFVMPAVQLIAIPWTGGAALALGALVALLQARHDVGRRRATGARAPRWALTGGVLAGVAMLFRIDLGLAVALGGGAAIWGLPRPVVKRAVIGAAIGLAPYVVHLATAGPGNVVRGMVDRPDHPSPRPRATFRSRPTRVTSSASRASSPPSTGRGRSPGSRPRSSCSRGSCCSPCSPSRSSRFGIWRVRRDPAAFRPRVLLAGALFGVGMFPQALQRADSAHLAWVGGTVVVLAARRAGRARRRRSGRRGGPRGSAPGAGLAVIVGGLAAAPDVHHPPLHRRGAGLGRPPEDDRDHTTRGARGTSATTPRSRTASSRCSTRSSRT